MEFNKIGVLGGMGPMATASFYQRMISYCQEKYDAIQDTDYPPIVIYSLPLSGFDESGIIDHGIVLKQLKEGIKTLEEAGCMLIVIPCNTVHVFIEELRAMTELHIISIVDETIAKVKHDGHGSVCLIASETTLNLGLYTTILEKNDISCTVPGHDDHTHITNLILEVMSGKISDDARKSVVSLVNGFSQDAGALIIGCTELPLAIKEDDVKMAVYDSLQILAEAAVEGSIKH